MSSAMADRRSKVSLVVEAALMCAKNHPQLTALDALREVAKFSDENCFNLTEEEFLSMAKQAWAERGET